MVRTVPPCMPPLGIFLQNNGTSGVRSAFEIDLVLDAYWSISPSSNLNYLKLTLLLWKSTKKAWIKVRKYLTLEALSIESCS